MIVWGATNPAGVLASLRVGHNRLSPTVRWSETHRPWSAQKDLPVEQQTLTKQPCLYGLYARRAPMLKWLNRSVYRLTHDYRASLGSGGLSTTEAMAPFEVADDEEDPLGPWVLLYVGQSGGLGSSKPRVEQYLNAENYSAAAGQSLKMTLALLFADPIDTRHGESGEPQSVEERVLHYYSRSLQHRFTDMRLAYLQVLTNVLPGPEQGGAFPRSDHGGVEACPNPQVCRIENESSLVESPHGDLAPNLQPWPMGARPLINGRF